MIKNDAVKIILLICIVSVLIVITSLISFFTGENSTFQHYITSFIPQTFLGAVTLGLILTFGTSVGLPRQIAALTAGYLFGSIYGAILATFSALAGCIITVLLSRYLFANIVKQNYSLPLSKVSIFFEKDTALKAFIIRLIPAGSNFLTNILAGTAKIPTLPYFLGSGIGFIPQMIIFSLMGAGLKINSQQQLIFSGGLFIFALLLSGYLYRKTKIKLI